MGGLCKSVVRLATPLFGLLLGLTSCSETEVNEAPPMAPPSLTKTWTVEGVFASPESAIYDEVRSDIYVSNVNGYTTNGLGYISAFSVDGEIIDATWLVGLNAPTGMAINGDTLFVADFNRVAEIDIPTRTIRRFYEAPDENPGVNDLALSPAGDLFASASSLGAVYKLENGKLVKWLQSNELQYANGLFADEESLFVAGFYLRRVDLRSKEIERYGDDAVLEDLESIEAAPAGGYFVTLIGERPIMYVDEAGKVVSVLERKTFTADIDVISSLNLLIAPSGGDSLSAFSIN